MHVCDHLSPDPIIPRRPLESCEVWSIQLFAVSFEFHDNAFMSQMHLLLTNIVRNNEMWSKISKYESR